MWSYRPYQNLGQIDHNLHNHFFDDVFTRMQTTNFQFCKFRVSLVALECLSKNFILQDFD